VSKQRQFEDFDAIVIGGGITGIYQTYLLRQMGLSVRAYEAGPDLGGTWFWNRYPGCRLDTESFAYGYFASKGILPDWTWSEHYAGQPELLRYVRAAAEKMKVRQAYRFNARVALARYDEAANRWRLELEDGSKSSCTYLVSAAGPLSATRMPNIEGVESFAGQSFHSSRWPRDDDGGSEGARPASTDFSGKRVGVIGTGATGVQIIPIVARTAATLHVFQRTPNWCVPLGNSPIPQDKMRAIQQDYEGLLRLLESTPTAFPYQRSRMKATEATEAERREFFDKLYDMPGYGIWLANYRDLLLDRRANRYLCDYIAERIRRRVHDPRTAEKLIPTDHPFGSRRVPMETNYYEVYNQPNVQLVDVKATPIRRITPQGIETAAGHIDLDVIVYATGFDGVTGALDRIDIRGKGGQRLRDAWAAGPATYLGLQVAGFPNFFTLVGAHNGAAFCNIGVCGGLQVEWVARMIGYMRQQELDYSEAEADAQDWWTQKVYDEFSKTLLADGDAWWVKSTVQPDGSVIRRALIYAGDAPKYRELCNQVESGGYKGFTLRRFA
jgi:(2,2,3-trimethyl-5-oxocyclopent-3-enyl)acetyl-CoA 1,5-monooxygenase